MKNLAQRYANLQKKMNKDMKELQARINHFKTRLRWYARHYNELKGPNPSTGRTPSKAEVNKLNADYESIKKSANKKINEHNAKMKKLEKRYSFVKRKTLLAMAKNLSSTSKK